MVNAQAIVTGPEVSSSGRRWVLVAMFVNAVLLGVLRAFSPLGDILQTLFLGFPLTVYVWAYRQTPQRRIPGLSLPLIYMSWPISIPIFSAWAFGLRGLVRAVGLILLLYGLNALGALAVMAFMYAMGYTWTP